MDEVKAMTQAGETVGRAVGTGLRTLRVGAMQVGQAGVDAVREATAETQAEVVATTRKARRQLVKDAQRTARSTMKEARSTVKDTRKAARSAARTTAKDLGRGAKRARKHAGRTARNARGAANDLFTAANPRKSVKSRRRWPWLVGIGALAAGAAAFAAVRGQQRSAQQSEPAPTPEQDRFATNGSAPQPRPVQEQPATDQANQRN